MDQIQAMRVFARVVEAGSFTRAADSLALPKGMKASADPVLLARPAPYGISLGRRLGEATAK